MLTKELHGQEVVTKIYNKGSDAASADVALVAAPGAGRRIVITGYAFNNQDGAAITRFALEDEDDNVLTTIHSLATNGHTGWMPCRLPVVANKAVEVNTTGASDHGVLIEYYIERITN